MRRLLPVIIILILLAVNVGAEGRSYLDQLPPLIDREIFFGDPEISGGQISPNGRYISFRKQFKDVLNIWVKRIDEPFEAARPLTADTTRPVRGYFWSRDSRYVLYIQDKGGNENFHIYAVDPKAELAPGEEVPPARDLTPIEGIRAYIYSLPKKTPNTIYIGLNDRDERYHDIYRLEIDTGERVLVRRNEEGVISWEFDLEGNLRLATRQTEDGGTEVLRIDRDTLTPIYEVSNEEDVTLIRFHKDGERIYMETNKGEDVDLSRLVLFNPETGEIEMVESDPEKEVDFGGTFFSRKTDELLGTYYVADRLRIYFRDKKAAKDYKKLKKQLPDGDIYFGSMTNDDRLMLVYVTSDTDPGATYLFDRRSAKVELLYRPRPNLPTEHLAPMKPIRYKARDGLTIPAYLTVPKGVKPKNIPVVVVPHGGPWSRDMWGYDPYAQFLANRGYAVLQPNFRSSSGYGKEFFNAGKRKWGEEMQHDVTDGARYLIDKGIADPQKVAIFGGSYGGYATLAGLAFTPDLYACGVSYVGPSNLITLLKSIPPYWETMRKFFNEHVGDPDNPEDVERLKRQSPLFSADKIKAPLLVVQGANDPRVKKAESDQIVVAMRDLSRDVEYIVAPDEGHGFAGEENRMAFVVASERFFSKHLGGRYQESVEEDIRKKLDELTVDIATVTLEEHGAERKQAALAPLPTVDASLVEPIELQYGGVMSRMGQEMEFSVTRSIDRATEGGTPALRIASESVSSRASTNDTFYVDQKTLLPIKRHLHQGQVVAKLRYGTDRIDGTVRIGGNEEEHTASLEAPIFGEGAALELTVAGLPLEPGYETVLRYYDILLRTVRVMSLNVTGVETVTVPAGAFEAYKIEIKPLDDEVGGGGTVFVSADHPRCIVRATYQLAAKMGGGTVTTELLSFK
ncbi:MAG: alpha/beta fold hydrolase [bacterium]|nr:MAG: alpha/beta fold hydrolase [bacterium]